MASVSNFNDARDDDSYLRNSVTVDLEGVTPSIRLSIQYLLDRDRTKGVLLLFFSPARTLLAAIAWDEAAAASTTAGAVRRIRRLLVAVII